MTLKREQFREKIKMNIEDAKRFVIKAITTALEGKSEVKEGMQLIGGESLLDLMKLDRVCLALDDFADNSGFYFDWGSEAVMSKSLGLFCYE